MKKTHYQTLFFTFFIVLFLYFVSACKSNETKQDISPEKLYGQLFYDVQNNVNLFSDSKTFIDCIPKYDVQKILEKYADLKDKSDASIMNFIQENFIIPDGKVAFRSDSADINQHISYLWNVLKRPADNNLQGTLIPLPNPYIVPGGRFREVYYWDSYFTMLGLQTDGEIETIRNMIKNFAYLINQYGFIPNGNRTYYLGRSQPPFFAEMIQLFAETDGNKVYTEYLSALEKEYSFWMNGEEKLSKINSTHRRVVQLPDGEILNRYYDDFDTPRPEGYREDLKIATEAIAKNPNLKTSDIYRNLRAAAESGWDFSCRWYANTDTLNMQLVDIHTTDIIPVDLNSLLYNLEFTIAKAYKLKGDNNNANKFKTKYEVRSKAINKYCWSVEKQFFMDYNFRLKKSTKIYSLAGVYPLFFKIADKTQADFVVQKIESRFLKPGGLISTLYTTHQQWDAPNGWAPLQWITINGLRNYKHYSLANKIKTNWLHNNERVYRNSFKMTEKYNVVDTTAFGGGGEYPNQDGFGWTNGVYQRLSKEKSIQPLTPNGE